MIHHHGIGHKIGHFISIMILGVMMAIVVGLIFGYIVAWLWNWLMPSIFGLGKITFWQAVGLILLAKIFLSGITRYGDHWHHGHDERRHSWRHHAWADGEYHLKDGWHHWEYYDDWWRAEGKEAFERYIEEHHRSSSLQDDE